MASKIHLYSASAGSGKTYTLSLEYLSLALSKLERKGYFRHILAVTFTNKAAEEMRERIVDFLQEFDAIAKGNKNPEAEERLEKIRTNLSAWGIELDRATLLQRASTCLRQILQEYGLFSVMTIDAFVQKISTAFTKELALPSQFEVRLDGNELMEMVMERLMAKLHGHAPDEFHAHLVQFTTEQVEENQHWNRIRDVLTKFLSLIFKEDFENIAPFITAMSLGDFQRIQQGIRGKIKAFEEAIRSVAETMVASLEQEQLHAEDFRGGSRSGMKALWTLSKGFNAKAMESLIAFLEQEQWYAKSCPLSTQARIDASMEALMPSFQTLVERYSQDYPHYALLKEINKDLAKMALISQAQQELLEIQQEKQWVPISVFAQKIQSIIAQDPIPFIYEKIGERYHHLLIDEFQDTSILQWKNFLPLLENNLAQGYQNLLVGDAKQSIYKFRGGEVGLISSLKSQNYEQHLELIQASELDSQRLELLFKEIHPIPLKTNYRSTKEIVDFNNQFFAYIGQLEATHALCPWFSKVFDEDTQQEAKRSEHVWASGVDFRFLPADRMDTQTWYNDQVLKLIRDYVSKGVPYHNIAVLFRNNKEAKAMAKVLKEADIPVLSSDSLLIQFAPSVHVILQALTLLQEPYQALAAWELWLGLDRVHGPSWVSIQEFPRNLEELQAKLMARNAPLDAARLAKSSLMDAVVQLISDWKLDQNPKEADYLQNFLDKILQFQQNQGPSIAAFLTHYQLHAEKQLADLSSSQHAVKISTIHKSKGLEYPIVIMPYATWPMNPKIFEKKWFDLSEIPSIVEDLSIGNKGLRHNQFLVRNSLLEHHPSLQRQQALEHQAIYLDALNTLYVGLTRAERRMHLLAHQSKKEADRQVAFLLRNFFEQAANAKADPLTEENAPHDYWDYNLRDGRWGSEQKGQQSALMPIAPSQVPGPKPSLRIQTAKAHLYSLAPLKQALGEVAHEILFQSEDPGLWEKLDQGRYYIQAQAQHLKTQIQTLLMDPEWKAFFHEAHLVMAEKDLLCPDGTVLRPDRVVHLNGHYWVLDFKTGKPKAAHQEQVKRYLQALHEMGYKPLKGRILYLEDLSFNDVE